MSDDEIYGALTKIFREVFDDDSINVHAGLSANDIEEWDSLSHIRLVVAAEMAFGVKYTSLELDTLKNVGDLVNLTQAKKNASGE